MIKNGPRNANSGVFLFFLLKAGTRWAVGPHQRAQTRWPLKGSAATHRAGLRNPSQAENEISPVQRAVMLLV